MKKLLFFLVVSVLVVGMAGVALATNGYQLIGVGQIQKSMGGAVTAAPMDAMTAITNPAGMARIGNRADFSMEAFMPVRSVDFTRTGGASEEGGSELYGIPAVGWTAPAFNKEGWFFGGGMYGTSGLGVDYGEVAFTPVDTFDGYSAILFWKMAPTVAVNINDRASVGFALNLDYQSVTVRQKFAGPSFAAFPGSMINFDLGRPTNQLGVGATVGGLYDINDMVTVGATYSSKQFFPDGEYRVGTGDIMNFNGATGAPGTYKMDLDFPQQLALGVAVTPIEPLLVAFDVKWINWSDTHDKVKLSGPANSFMTPSGPSSSTELPFGWDDQWVYALGVQYKATPALNMRAGFNYSKAPIDEADVFNNLVFPAIVEKHFGLGFDYMLGKHWGIGATYMKAFKEELTGKGDLNPAMGFGPDSNTKISLEQDSLGVQLTYLF